MKSCKNIAAVCFLSCIWLVLGCAHRAVPQAIPAPPDASVATAVLGAGAAPAEAEPELRQLAEDRPEDPRHIVGELRFGVILVNFTSDPPRQSVDEVRYAMFEHPYSIARYVDEVSYGAARLSGDVAGWYTPGEGLYGTGAEYTNCYPAVNNALNLAADDLELAAYDGFLIVVQDTDEDKGCAGGNASFGKIPVDTVQGRVHAHIARTRAPFTLGASGDFARTTQSTVAHELTHSFGYHYHAAAYVCGEAMLSDDPESCRLRGTWDQFDIMGIRAQATHPSSAIKEAFGWLDLDEVQTVTQSGRYTLEPYEVDTSGLKTLKIPLAEPIDVPYGKGFVLDHLYLEYRGMSGIDERSEFFRTVAQEDGTGVLLDDVHGLLIHGVDSRGEFPFQVLFDGNPASMSPAYPPHEVCDAQLHAGQQFFEPHNGIRIEVLEVQEGQSVLVQVSFEE